MPSYDYLCELNGRVIEARHAMSQSISNWGELCETAGVSPGDTPPATPVKRLISGAHVVRGVGSGEAPPCETGAPCCGGNLCGLN